MRANHARRGRKGKTPIVETAPSKSDGDSATSWTTDDERIAAGAIRYVLSQHGRHFDHRQQEKVTLEALDELLDKPREGVADVFFSASRITERMCDDVDVVVELEKLEQRLLDKARSDLLTGHAARVVRALKVAVANVRAGKGKPTRANAKGVHRQTLHALSRIGWEYLSHARTSWAGIDPVMQALGEDEAIGNHSFMTPSECERWAEGPEEQAYLADCLREGREVPANPYAHDTEVIDGRTIVRPARAWLWVDSFVSLLVSNGIGVMDEEHRAMTLDGLKHEAREAVAALGPKRSRDARTIMRAILKRFGSEEADRVFRARDKAKARKKRHFPKVTKAR